MNFEKPGKSQKPAQAAKPESNFFQLLGVDQHYELSGDEIRQLRQRSRALQRQYHPDRLAMATPHEQRLAAQFSALVNTAVRTLCDPVLRALHMLDLAGIEIPHDQHTISDSEFLMQQMALRESLEEASSSGDSTALEALAAKVDQHFREVQRAFSAALDGYRRNGDRQPGHLHELIGRLRFYSKLADEIESASDSL